MQGIILHEIFKHMVHIIFDIKLRCYIDKDIAAIYTI